MPKEFAPTLFIEICILDKKRGVMYNKKARYENGALKTENMTRLTGLYGIEVDYGDKCGAAGI